MKRIPSPRAGYWFVALAALFWGINGSVSKQLLHTGLSPLSLAQARAAIAVLGLGLYLGLFQPRILLTPVKRWGSLFALGLALTLVTFSYYQAIGRLPVAIAVFIQFTAPALIVAYQGIFQRKIPSIPVWAALLLVLLGVLFLAQPHGGSFGTLDPLGLGFAVAAAFFFAAYALLGESLGSELDSKTTVFYGFSVATLIWLALQPPWRWQAQLFATDNLLLLLYVGIFGTLIPFALEMGALRKLDASRVSITATLEPVFGSIVAFLWFHEQLSIIQVIGAVLVIGSTTVIQLDSAPHETNRTTETLETGTKVR